MLVQTHVLFGLLEIMATMCRMQFVRDENTMATFADPFDAWKSYCHGFRHGGFCVRNNGRTLEGENAGPYLGLAS